MAGKNKYLEMFQGPLFKDKEGVYLDTTIEHVDWARKTLKKEDRIVWYLRLHKYDVLANQARKIENAKQFSSRFQNNEPLVQLSKKESSFVQHMENVRCTTEDFSTRQIKLELEHMIDMDLYDINHMLLGWDSPKRVFDQVEDFQLSWQAKNEGKSTLEYGHRLIEFDDGSAWFDLQASGCKQESDLMGHCGNGSHNPNSPETILSFRKPVDALEGDEASEEEGQRWTPYLTFILNKETGELGEMKGRANSKPAARYHDYIIDLLKSDDRIKKVVGGGYKAENNFALADLDENKYEQLMEEKPTLFSIFELWKKHGVVDKIGEFDFKDAIDTALYEVGKVEHEGNAYYQLWNTFDLEDLSKHFGLGELESYHKIIEEGHADHWDFQGDWKAYYDDNMEALLSTWLTENPSEALKIKLQLEKTHEEKIEDNDWDMSDATDIIALAKEEDTFLNSAFFNAAYRAEETGAIDELGDNYKSLIEDFFKTDELTLLRDPDNYDKFNVVFDTKQFFSFVENNEVDFKERVMDDQLSEFEALQGMIENDELVEANDLEVPYNGFSGFCEETLKTEFAHHVSEAVHEHCKAQVVTAPFGHNAPEQVPGAIIAKQNEDEYEMAM